jgi:hypothetical protein
MGLRQVRRNLTGPTEQGKVRKQGAILRNRKPRPLMHVLQPQASWLSKEMDVITTAHAHYVRCANARVHVWLTNFGQTRNALHCRETLLLALDLWQTCNETCRLLH